MTERLDWRTFSVPTTAAAVTRAFAPRRDIAVDEQRARLRRWRGVWGGRPAARGRAPRGTRWTASSTRAAARAPIHVRVWMRARAGGGGALVWRAPALSGGPLAAR